MNDVLHIVDKRWYHLYFGLVVFFCALTVAGYCLATFVPHFASWHQTFGLTPVTLTFALVPIAYGSTLYWYIAKRNPPMAAFGFAMVFALLVFSGLSLTAGGSGGWFYIAGWLMSIFFVGMFGAPMVLGTVLLAALYLLLGKDFDFAAISRQDWSFLLATTAMCLTSFLFWRHRFNDPMDRQLTQLTGMLRSNQEQSAILIQSITDGVIVTNIEGKIGLINPAASAMTEWPITEATNIEVQLVAKLAQEDGKELPSDANPFVLVLKNKKSISQTLQLTGRKGRKQIISLVISPVIVPGSGIGGAVAVMRDISEERAAEEQRAEFISTASHEMRTPVAAIEGYLALALNDKVSTIDSRARNYLEKAHFSTQHLGQLFQDLLTSAKAEDGRLSNHPSVVEMGSFLEHLVEDLRFAAQKKNLTADFVVGSNESIDATKESPEGPKVVKPLYYVYVDPDRLREVITNLFDNAVKYTDQGKISIGLTGNAEVVQLYVRDTGNGIPADDIPHLFQKFYRVDNSATRTIGGTGLGLFISRKIIELYKGRIWVESTLGKGSTFFINLPRIDSLKAQQLLQTAVDASAAIPAS